MITIKPIHAEYEDFLKEMLYQAIYIPEGEAPFDREELDEAHWKKYYAGWGKEGDIGFITLVESKFMGAIWARLFTEEDRGYGFVDTQTPELSMAILPAYRGRGVGTILKTRLLSDLQSNQNIHQVSLSVDPRNWVYAWYKRLGFEEEYFDGYSYTLLKKISSK